MRLFFFVIFVGFGVKRNITTTVCGALSLGLFMSEIFTTHCNQDLMGFETITILTKSVFI